MDNIIDTAKRFTGLEENEEALFAFLCMVGKEYVDLIQGENDRTDTIETAVEALEENLHK